jgi:hypothetical protein
MKKVEGGKAGKQLSIARQRDHFGLRTARFYRRLAMRNFGFDRSRPRIQYGIDHLPHRIPSSCRAGVLSPLEAGAGPGFNRRFGSGRSTGHGTAVHVANTTSSEPTSIAGLQRSLPKTIQFASDEEIAAAAPSRPCFSSFGTGDRSPPSRWRSCRNRSTAFSTTPILWRFAGRRYPSSTSFATTSEDATGLRN